LELLAILVASCGGGIGNNCAVIILIGLALFNLVKTSHNL